MKMFLLVALSVVVGTLTLTAPGHAQDGAPFDEPPMAEARSEPGTGGDSDTVGPGDDRPSGTAQSDAAENKRHPDDREVGPAEGAGTAQRSRGGRPFRAGFPELCLLAAVLPILLGYPVMIGFIARRKGRNPVGWAVLAVIPGAGMACLWLVSLTDADVKRRLDLLAPQLSASPAGQSEQEMGR